MQKKGCGSGCRAWNILRLALKWARKCAESRRAIVMDHRRKLLKGIAVAVAACRSDPVVDAQISQRRYGERQMSFDATPIIHVKMHRPRYGPLSTIFNIPCIKPPNVHFDDFDDDDDEHECGRLSFFKAEDDQENWRGYSYYDDDHEIDVKAEQFITRFYQQTKIQTK